MPLTPNDPSPCGNGKIKYVCKDLAADLEKVTRTLEAEQRLAAVQQLDGLIATKGPRAPFLALKGDILIALDDYERLAESVAVYLEHFPQSPVALTQAAILSLGQQAPLQAIEYLQESLEALQDSLKAAPKEQEATIPDLVYAAIGLVAHAMLMRGDSLSARAHFVLQTRLSQGSDPAPIQILMRINQSRQEPLLLKEGLDVETPEMGVLSTRIPEARRASLIAAVEDSHFGLWSRCVDELHAALKHSPLDPYILRSLAVLHGHLGDVEAACAAWRQYSTANLIPAEDAIDAEALVQLLEPEKETVDEVVATLPIEHLDKALERLLTDKRASSLSIDLKQLSREGAPPPKAVYLLLDRPLPETSEGIELATVPRILGEIFVFGKQTDRPARIEFLARKSEDYSEKLSVLKEILGDQCLAEQRHMEHGQSPIEETKVGEAPLTESLLSFGWRLPEDATRQLQEQLVGQARRQALLEKWPQTPFAVFGGKSAAEAASDPKLALRVLAAILNLELAGEQQMWDLDFNELRRQLNLPLAGPIDPKGVNLDRLPVHRYSRLIVSALSDEALDDCWQRAMSTGSPVAKERLGREILSRPSFEKSALRPLVLSDLAKQAANSDEALSMMQQAQQAAEEAGESPAIYLLEELALRWQRQDLTEWRALLDRIQTKHVDEPGVGPMLFRMLVDMGVLSPDGSPGPIPRAAANAQAAARAGAKAGAAGSAPAPAGGIWTPGQAAPAEEKSGLWLPGM